MSGEVQPGAGPEPDAPEPAPKPARGWRLRFETVGSISAIVVGVAALFVSWDQARVMRAQQHATVLPAIQIDGYRSQDGTRASIGVRVSNNGVGPAIIRSVRLARDGVQSEDFAQIEALLPEGYELSWFTMIGRIMGAGEAVAPAEFNWPQGALNDEQSAALADEWTRWDVAVCYCSVFERCWIASTSGVGARAEEVSACPVPDHDIFERLGARPL